MISLKLGALVAQSVGDPTMFGKVFTNMIRNGRRVLEGVARREVRREGLARADTQSRPADLSSSIQAQQYVQTKGVVSRLLIRNRRGTLVEELKQRFSSQKYGGQRQPFGSYRGLAHKISLAFVAVGYANGSYHAHPYDMDGFDRFDSVCSEIKVGVRTHGANIGMVTIIVNNLNN